MTPLSTAEAATPAEALLGVERSVMGSRWRLRHADERAVLSICQRLGVPEVLARVLAGRGISADAAEDFLSPTLRNLLPDPSHLLDMDTAATRLADAVERGEGIGIFGDYDVDGATSSALLMRYLKALGMTRLWAHIPDRIAEGYGPNIPALMGLKSKGASLVITVDCGAVAFEPLQAAADAGLDVLVIDHHIGDVQPPPAVAVVNPNRFDETSAHGHLAAVGVVFLLVVATNRILRERGRAVPDPRIWLDLVALGTVCDVVALTGVNRALVTQGLKVLAQRGNTGLAALADVARMDEAPAAYHLGFLLGPRINAGGRVGKAELGVRLLTTEDASEAEAIAAQLDQYNAERKVLETLALEQAMQQAESRAEQDAVILVDGDWHPGVIGIVAGRLKEKFHKPVAVIARDGALGKASARSVSGVDFGAAVAAARSSELLVAGGGHAMAAGFTAELARLEELRSFLNHRMQAGVARYGEERTLTLDAQLTPGAATVELLHKLKEAEPYGMGNPGPRFAFANLRLVKADIVGEQHIRCIFTDGGVGGKAAGARLQGIAFRATGTPLEQALAEAQRGRRLHVAGQLKLNSWNGSERVDFQIEDMSLAD